MRRIPRASKRSGFEAARAGQPTVTAGQIPWDPPVDAISEAHVREASERLYADGAVLQWLEQARGIAPATAADFHLGLRYGRIEIPIRDHDGWARNLRRYHPAKSPKMLGLKGRQMRLFPKRAFCERLDDPIIACEGELDAILGWQEGLRTLTSGGAGTLQPWVRNLDHLRGERVWVMFDNDDAGRAGAAKLRELLAPVVAEAAVCRIPLTTKGADLTDWLIQRRQENRRAA